MRIRIEGVNHVTKKLASGRVANYYYHRATRQRLPGEPGSDEFMTMVNHLNRGPAREPARDRSFAHLRETFETSLVFGKLAEGTKKEYRRHLRYVEPILGPFGVSQITSEHIQMMLSEYRETPALAAAIGRTLSRVFGYAKKLGWIAISPATDLELPRSSKDAGQVPLGERQIRRFRDFHPYGTRVRLAFELYLSTALWIGDGCRVSTDDLRDGAITMITQKARTLVHAVVTTELRAAFEAWERARAADGRPLGRYAFGDWNGASLHKRGISEELESAYVAAGFDRSQRTHALRYTACIRLFEAGFTFEQIAEAAGHRMTSMAEHYCRKKRNARERARAINAIDEMSVDTAD